jgi:integrase
MAFLRGKTFSVYVTGTAGRVQRSTGTSDKALATKMERMLEGLADKRDFKLLEAVRDNRLSLGKLWDAYSSGALDALRDRLSSVSIKSLWAGWTADAKQRAPKSWDQQLRQAEWMLQGLESVVDMTPGALRNRLNLLHLAEGTRRHYLYSTASFCNYAVAMGAIPVSPVSDKAKIRRPAKANKRQQWKAVEVDKEILSHVSGALRLALTICAATGADRSSVLKIKVSDVRLLDEGVETDPVNEVEHRINIPGTKNQYRNRSGVRVEPWAVSLLRDAIVNKKPNEFVVVGVSADMMTRGWKRAVETAGYSDYWLRDTRHSYAVRALFSGYPLWQVSEWLGHASAAMTAEIYLKFDPTTARMVRARSRALATSEGGAATTNLTTSTQDVIAAAGIAGHLEPPEANADPTLPLGATMRTPGLEPGWVAPPAPKAGASTNFATSAYGSDRLPARAV